MTNYLIALSALALVTFSANAQTKRNAPGDQQPYHEKMRGKHMHRSGNMMKDLNFSNAQKEQLKHIRSEYHNKINQLEQNKSITLQDYKLKKAELQKEQKAKVESLLTAEQKEKLAKATEENTAKREMMEQKRVDKMKSQLNLTDAQVSKLQSQHEIFKSQAKAIKENASLRREQKKEKLMELRKSIKESEKDILTTDQLQKREEMKNKRLNDMKNKRTEKTS